MFTNVEGAEKLDWTMWDYPLFYIATFVLGCCVGSYLNAVIYRMPRGMSTREPKRSFCPICKKSIPIFRNIPIFTWLIQRGKCAECDAPIAVRYLLVELLTGLLWLGSWWLFAVYKWQTEAPPTIWFPAALALFFIVIVTIFVVITFIDIEHLIIPLPLSIGGSVVAVAASMVIPQWWGGEVWYEGLKWSLFGGVMGFAALWLVVLLGKLLFGRRKIDLEEPMKWHIADSKGDSENPHDNVSLVLDDEDNYWHDIFYRKSDKLLMNGVTELEVNGEKVEQSEFYITQDSIHLEDKTIALEELKSMSGKVTSMVIPREAMGMGDVHLLGLIGLCLGYKSLLFVVLAACGFGILIHIAARAGLGKQMPFGPSLILGALLWTVCGPELVDAYMTWVRETIKG